MAITKGAFSDLLKSDDLLKAMEKELKQTYMNDFNDTFAYSQLQGAQQQMTQQYTNQYQNMLGQLANGQHATNGAGGYMGQLNSGALGLSWDKYVQECRDSQMKTLSAPIPAKLKKPSNEAWLDSKIAEVSFVL